MIFKLMEAAEGRWRRLNGAHLAALVRVGAEFKRVSWSKEPRRRSPRDRRSQSTRFDDTSLYIASTTKDRHSTVLRYDTAQSGRSDA